MKRTKENAELTRRALLEASLKVFSQKGYDATRLEDVAKTAGVTRGAIYHHFGGKIGLFRALIEEASESASQAVQRAIAEGGSFLDIARRVLIYSLELLQTESRFRRITALYLFQGGNSPELAEFRQRSQDEMKRLVDEVAGFFQTALDQGAIRSDLDPYVGARAFVAYQNGLALQWFLDPDLLSSAESAKALADVFVYGIDQPSR